LKEHDDGDFDKRHGRGPEFLDHPRALEGVVR
jgi:hypothetical protein